MGKTKHNQTDYKTERKLSSRAENFLSCMDSQNQNQAQNQWLARKTPAAHKQDLNPQPGQNISSTPVEFAHRFDRWGRNPNEKKSARTWQNLAYVRRSERREINRYSKQSWPQSFCQSRRLSPGKKNNFQ